MNTKYIVGYKKDMLTIIEKMPSIEKYGQKVAVYKVKCDCGKEFIVDAKNLYSKKSCGCIWHNTKPILPGSMFGKLKVIEKTDIRKHNSIVYKCECQCSKKAIVFVRSDNLRNGTTTSCGCVHDELLRQKSKIAYDNSFVYDTSIPRIKSSRLQSNNTSGYTGVRWHSRLHKWQASIQFQKKSYFLGYYDDIKLAAEAYKIAKQKTHEKFLEWYKENKND